VRTPLRKDAVGACSCERIIAGDAHQLAKERIAGLGRGADERQEGVLGGATWHELAIPNSQSPE
jgi:hypothetical protein